MFRTVQRPGVRIAAYGTGYYKKPLKSFGLLREGHNANFSIPSVVIFLYDCTEPVIELKYQRYPPPTY